MWSWFLCTIPGLFILNHLFIGWMLSFSTAVPSLLGTRGRFYESQSFHGPGRGSVVRENALGFSCRSPPAVQPSSQQPTGHYWSRVGDPWFSRLFKMDSEVLWSPRSWMVGMSVSCLPCLSRWRCCQVTPGVQPLRLFLRCWWMLLWGGLRSASAFPFVDEKMT